MPLLHLKVRRIVNRFGSLAPLVALGLLVLATPTKAAQEGIACTPEPTDMSIGYGDLVTCEIRPFDDADDFRFLGSVGDLVSVVALVTGGFSTGGEFCVELVDPNQILLGSTCVPALGLRSVRIDRRLSLAGTYRVRILERNAPTGNFLTYHASLERIVPFSPSAPLVPFGQSMDDEINPGGDVDLHRFRASLGDRVLVRATQLTTQDPDRPCMELFDPMGTRIQGPVCVASAPVTFDVNLVTSGVYTIRMDAEGLGESYRLQVDCLGECSGVPGLLTRLAGCTTCRPGNLFVAQTSITNFSARQVEFKFGVYLPDGTPLNLLGNKHLELPPGFTFNGEVFRVQIPGGIPQGTYRLCGRLVELELGEDLAESCQTFGVVP